MCPSRTFSGPQVLFIPSPSPPTGIECGRSKKRAKTKNLYLTPIRNKRFSSRKQREWGFYAIMKNGPNISLFPASCFSEGGGGGGGVKRSEASQSQCYLLQRKSFQYKWTTEGMVTGRRLMSCTLRMLNWTSSWACRFLRITLKVALCSAHWTCCWWYSRSFSQNCKWTPTLHWNIPRISMKLPPESNFMLLSPRAQQNDEEKAFCKYNFFPSFALLAAALKISYLLE